MGENKISIHALREEGDVSHLLTHLVDELFLSTPSARRATGYKHIRSGIDVISIHALREEGDMRILAISHDPTIFLSTPSARRATDMMALCEKSSDISIHALREEGDLYDGGQGRTAGYFYPRPPRGGRHTRPCERQLLA